MLWTPRGGACLKRYKRPSKADEHDMCLQDGLLHVRSPLLWGFTMGRTPTWKQWRRNTRTGPPRESTDQERGDVHANENTCEQVETSWNLSWRCRNIMTKLPCMTQDLAGVSYPLASVSLHPFIGCFTEIPGPLPPEVEFHGWPSAVQCFQDLHDGGSVNSMASVSMPWKEEPLGSGMILAARFYRR